MNNICLNNMHEDELELINENSLSLEEYLKLKQQIEDGCILSRNCIMPNYYCDVFKKKLADILSQQNYDII